MSTPAMIRFGEMTEDELFVTADAAAGGVRIQNLSDAEPLVILKHFGPGNPDARHKYRDAEARRRKEFFMNAHTKPALHNAMWPGLVGKGPDSEPPIDLDTMLDLTAAANVDGVRFDGVDLFLFDPHVDIDSDRDDAEAARRSHPRARVRRRIARRAGVGADGRRLGDGQRARIASAFSRR